MAWTKKRTRDGKRIRIIADHGEIVGDIDSDDVPEGIAEARATLIAAAPEMLAALKMIREEVMKSGNWGARDFGWPVACKAVHDAIISAEVTCATCGNPATCHGVYDGISAYSCDKCCGHGGEDGECNRLS